MTNERAKQISEMLQFGTPVYAYVGLLGAKDESSFAYNPEIGITVREDAEIRLVKALMNNASYRDAVDLIYFVRSSK